ncbi:dnaJ homolog subfamily C member 1 [Chelonus insularis]|uniref:dnaJ homolog subfamily C member 1 n=1 Tax=Chelonus insularis TaxID=460826 RepID=UPI00158DC217|nr:dnaJ homolog subfamily C member 1 [Chelonus insularis]
MKIVVIILSILQFLNICKLSVAWDDEELEVFDVVEEVNQNFYELLGISNDANSTTIKKAFRQLSLQLHPDKNDAPDAEVKFRNLVAVYDVLKDVNKRKHYDNVLVNGLPNWRSAVYYYRHVRKMGLLEMSIILFIVITIGQYLVAWAAYFEKRYTYEQVLGSKLQKLQKKNRKTKTEIPDLAEILEKIPTPSVWNTLPFQLPCWTVASIVGIPSTIRAIKAMIEERKRRKQEEEAALAEENEEMESEPIVRGPRRRRAGFIPQEQSGNITVETKKKENIKSTNVHEKPKYTGGLWTDDDIAELIKLVKKYPGGTPERWEKISDAMNRSISEVTHMAKKIKDEGIKPGQQSDEIPINTQPKKVKTRVEVVDNVSTWTQDQQKALESALLKYPKGSSVDRWEKIANCVDGKTKEECQIRYRQLVDLVKKKQQDMN